jgi:hypothetical protein
MSPSRDTWQSVLDLNGESIDLRLYRCLLSASLGGLDRMEERSMVRYLIRRCDVILGISS